MGNIADCRRTPPLVVNHARFTPADPARGRSRACTGNRKFGRVVARFGGTRTDSPTGRGRSLKYFDCQEVGHLAPHRDLLALPLLRVRNGCLIDHPKPGRPRVVESHAIITRLLTRPPSKFQITHWNSRLLAQHLEISKTTVQAVWKEYGIKPCGPDKFTFATVPALSASVVAVAGLHIGPQCNAIIVAVANKPSRPEQIQPIRSAVCAEQFHRYLQSRTAVLPAGKPLTTGQPFGQRPHPCNFETLTLFCLQLAQTHPDQRLHVIFDVGTGQLEAVRSALSTLPNIRTHYTSTPTIWFHLVDIWLSIVERQRRQQRQAFPKADTHEQSQASRRSRTQTSHTCRSDLPG